MDGSSYLADLVESIAAERGWSLREVARRSGLPSATVQKIAWKGATTIPRRETLDALAYGLGVPVTQLMEATARDAGLKATKETDREDSDITITIAAMEELPKERRHEIASLARAMLKTYRDGG